MALHIVNPSYGGVDCICGFMMWTNYAYKDLVSRKDTSEQLKNFTDSILRQNAIKWRTDCPHFCNSEITAEWVAWASLYADPTTPTLPVIKQRKEPRDSRRASGSNLVAPMDSRLRDICRQYNTAASCPNPANNCSVGQGPYHLRHVCNKLENGSPCLGNHSKPEHSAVTSLRPPESKFRNFIVLLAS